MLLHPHPLCWAQRNWTLLPLPLCLQRCGSDSSGRRKTPFPGSQVWPGCFREDQRLLLLTALVVREGEGGGGYGRWWTGSAQTHKTCASAKTKLGENTVTDRSSRADSYWWCQRGWWEEESPDWPEFEVRDWEQPGWCSAVCFKAQNVAFI